MMNDDARMAFRSAFDSGAPHEDQKEAALRWVADATASKKARERETQVTREQKALVAIASAEASGDPTKALDKLLEDDPGLLDVLTTPAKPIEEWHGKSEPRPVIWREPAPNEDPMARADAVVSEGEVAVLSAPGGTGKSYLTLALARAASTKHEYGAACGLCIRPGPVLLVSYEDDPIRIAARLDGMNTTKGDDPVFKNLHVLQNPEPLFAAAGKDDPGKARPTETWDRLWEQARKLQPVLVIIDPASAALADVSVSESGPVRLFMTALSTEAKRAGSAVLVVAHDTKAARNEARASGNPGAGAIAGSGQWFDASRGVLYLHRCHDASLILACTKANYGRINWGARLGEDMQGSKFCGFKLTEQLTNASDAMEHDATAKPKNDTGKSGAQKWDAKPKPGATKKKPRNLEDI